MAHFMEPRVQTDLLRDQKSHQLFVDGLCRIYISFGTGIQVLSFLTVTEIIITTGTIAGRS
jgi:hypothetical protein